MLAFVCKTKSVTFMLDATVVVCQEPDHGELTEDTTLQANCVTYTQDAYLREMASKWTTEYNLTDLAMLAKHWNPTN
jgi:hypothetical protein